MATDKDLEQDQMIRDNAVRITRNEESIRRQTEALEQIRDHYYPPPEKWWKKTAAFFVKVVCVIVAYLGIAQTVDWLWNVRESESLAERYAEVAERLRSVVGDLSGAIACYEKAIALDSNESDYMMTLTFLKGLELAGDLLDNERPPTDAEKARINAALAEATVLKELQPRNAMPYVLMAQAFILTGEKEEAVAAVEAAVARAPEDASVRVSGCAVNHLTGHRAEARAHLDEAARLNPTLPLVLAWQGFLALDDDRDVAAARAWFEKLARRIPRFALAHTYLGRVLMLEKSPDLERARAAFQRALVLDAKLASAMHGIARTYERENKLIVARLWLDRALAIDANYLPALVARAGISGKLGEWPRAVTDLTKAISLDTLRADLYSLRAEAAEKAGDAARAKSDRATAAALAEK